MPDVTPTREVDALKEALDTWAIELPDMPGQVLVNGEKWPTIFKAARGYLRLLTEGREIRWCVNHRNEAWDDWQGDLDDNPVFNGYRCAAAAWIEGANAWDCNIKKARVLIEGDQ